MKVLLVGKMHERSTNAQMRIGLEQCGCKVDGLDYRVVIEKYGRVEAERRLLHVAERGCYDVAILCKINNMGSEVVDKLNEHVKTWYWFVDPLYTADLCNAVDYASRATWSSATSSEVRDSFDGGYQIYEGYNPRIFRSLRLRKSCDVVFVGDKDAEREDIINRLLDAGIKVATHGNGWDGPNVWTDELNKIYNENKIVLNISRDPCIFSNRVLQVLGSGSFLLTTHSTDLQNSGLTGGYVIFAKNEVVSTVKYFLEHSTLREGIAKKGHRLAKRYTWQKQMNKVMAKVKEEQGVEMEKKNRVDGYTDGYSGFINVFPALVVALQAKTVVEIGTGCFISGAKFVEGLEQTDGLLVTCDIQNHKDLIRDNPNVPKEQLPDPNSFDHVEYLQCTSTELREHWESPIDILYIDGDHTYQGCKKDYDMFYPFVRKGGLILIHDTLFYKDIIGKFFDEVKGEAGVNLSSGAGLGIIVKTEEIDSGVAKS